MFALLIAFTRVKICVIHPDECIDCGVCEPECPVDAIKPDTEPDAAEWVEFNRKYSEQWPNIQLEEILYQMQIKWKTSQVNLRNSSLINREKGINF